MHDLEGLHGIGLADADEDQVMEHAFGREGEVHQLREVHLEDRQEQLQRGGADVEVLHRGQAHDRRRIDGVPPVRDGGEVEDRVEVRQRIITGVVAKRPLLAQRFLGVHVALEHDVRVGGNFEIVGKALDQGDRFAAEITREQEFIQPVRQRGGGAKREHRVAAQEHRHRHPPAGFVVAPSVPGADLLQLPMHAGGAVIIDLHAVHADVPRAGIRVPRHHSGQRDESPAIQGPAFLDGEVEQGRRRRGRRRRMVHARRGWPGLGAGGGRLETMYLFLAGPLLDGLGFGVAQVQRRAKQLDGLPKTGGWAGFHQRAQFGGNRFDRVGAQAQRHPALRAQGVHRQRDGRHHPVDQRFLDEQRLAAARTFHLAVGQFGDFQLRRQRLGNARQLARVFQRADKISKGIKGHDPPKVANARRLANLIGGRRAFRAGCVLGACHPGRRCRLARSGRDLSLGWVVAAPVGQE